MSAPDIAAKARTVAGMLAARLFSGRKGHGGTPLSGRVCERHLSQAEVEALIIVAFEAGAQWERNRNTTTTKGL